MIAPPDQDYDASGLLCPLPVLRARKILAGMSEGQVLRIVTTDAMALIDMPHFCGQTGHEYLGAEDEGVAAVHFIRRGEVSA
ncbi:MAG: sulfurtransferase TusA family protein [Rhodobacteraceae bacterium]|nr:sulfurtransferase TusA family protein [Paracoccaceae bacterium]